MGLEKRANMYTNYFGFREEPFSITPDPRFFYANPGHEEAYASIMYGVRQRKGYISLIGEAGTGKTTLLRRVVGDLEKTIRVAFYYYNTTLTFDEFLDFICTSFGLQTKEGRKLEKIQALDKFLRERFAEGGTGVLIIDEAHHLADEVLENLRLLSNIELDNHKLLQIVLVGQPELEQKLDRPELRQLKQRIAISCRLGCLKPQAIEPFIHYRMQRAGCTRYDVFTPQAIQLIAARSDGIPRVINTICDNSLSVAYQASQLSVSEQVVEKVTDNLRLKGSLPTQQQAASQQGAKKVHVIRVDDEPWGRAATFNPPSDLPEIWVGERPWGWTRQLHWVGIGTVAALSLLYLGNNVLFPPRASDPQAKAVGVIDTRSTPPPRSTATGEPPTRPASLPSETPALAQMANRPTSAAEPPSSSTAPTTEPTPQQKTATAEPPVLASLGQEPAAPTTVRSEPSPAVAASQPATNAASSGTPAPQPPSVTASLATASAQPSTSATTSTADSKGQAITVARGDTVSELVLRVYGNYSALALDLIKEHNPNIANLDRILIGQRLVLPSLSRDTLLRKQSDGTYRLILGTFPTALAAEKMGQSIRNKGYSTVVTKRPITSARILYRVELEKLPDTAAVDQAWKLVAGS
jgi:general secretion pathway protein A